MRFKELVSIGLVGLLLSGCAGALDYSDYAQSIDSSNQAGQQVVAEYFKKKSIDNANVFKALAGQGSTDPQQQANNSMAIVLYTIMSQQTDEKVLQQFQPHYAAKPTTNGDIGKSLADNFLPALVKAGAAVYLGGKVVDGLADNGTQTVLGTGATMVGGAGNTTNIPQNSYNPDQSGVSPLEGFDQDYTATPIPEIVE